MASTTYFLYCLCSLLPVSSMSFVTYVLFYLCFLVTLSSYACVLHYICPLLPISSTIYLLHVFFYYPCPLYTCVHYYLCPLYTCVHYNLCPLYTCGMSSIFLPMNSGNVDERMLMSLKYNILDYLYFPHVSVNLLFFWLFLCCNNIFNR